MEAIEIISYRPEYADDFKRISYTWIDKYFGIEEEDRNLMEAHKTEIIDKGRKLLKSWIP